MSFRSTSTTSPAFDPAESLRRVAVLTDTSGSYVRSVLTGISRHQKERRLPWSVHLIKQSLADPPPSWLHNWDGDGILARVDSEETATALIQARVPVVNISGTIRTPSLPTVLQDAVQSAQIAAEFFCSRGFRHFAFCGDASRNWSVKRGQHFSRILAERGHSTISRNLTLGEQTSDALMDSILNWLRGLPKPLAIWACDDEMGLLVLNACLLGGIRVPEDIAVLGVDNEVELCELSSPPLSSIELDGEGAGYHAARMLDRLMSGKSTGEQMITPLAPRGLVSRQSTDVTAVEDPYVAMAARILQEEACQGLQITDLVRRVPLARRLLEQRFKTTLGRTLREEAWRIQFNRAKTLLQTTTLPMQEVADQCGFRHVEYFSTAFKRYTGISPTQFRQRMANNLSVPPPQVAE